ncbi:hypothetical protein LWI28_007125 [Acer negundo]|uniref:Uncharacterized protein n=1 Tax=Acer negundo TaxID=4023 RepID=A0AAD5IDE5_ACENE|nr:hypothetical protein LWI28_007125 [Acer negundo]
MEEIPIPVINGVEMFPFGVWLKASGPFYKIQHHQSKIRLEASWLDKGGKGMVEVSQDANRGCSVVGKKISSPMMGEVSENSIPLETEVLMKEGIDLIRESESSMDKEKWLADSKVFGPDSNPVIGKRLAGELGVLIEPIPLTLSSNTSQVGPTRCSQWEEKRTGEGGRYCFRFKKPRIERVEEEEEEEEEEEKGVKEPELNQVRKNIEGNEEEVCYESGAAAIVTQLEVSTTDLCVPIEDLSGGQSLLARWSR